MENSKILLVDDEPSLIKMLTTILTKEGFTHVDAVTSGEQALLVCEKQSYDLIVLDVMLPRQSGFDIVPTLRKLTNAPILFLTARTGDYDLLSGFTLGGDDYITKPFNPLEVVARIRAHLRRYLQQSQPSSQKEIYDFGRFQVDTHAGELRVLGKVVECPAQVFHLLLFLCQYPNRIFSKQELYERVWGDKHIADDNTVMVHVHRIRERIEENPSTPKYLLTVRGMGYKLINRGRP